MTMKKQILIISTSPRRGGNSDRLADEFARGAGEAGHRVEKSIWPTAGLPFAGGVWPVSRRDNVSYTTMRWRLLA